MSGQLALNETLKILVTKLEPYCILIINSELIEGHFSIFLQHYQWICEGKRNIIFTPGQHIYFYWILQYLAKDKSPSYVVLPLSLNMNSYPTLLKIFSSARVFLTSSSWIAWERIYDLGYQKPWIIFKSFYSIQILNKKK